MEEFTTLDIFDAPEDLPKPVTPLGPFLTSKDIKLTKGEKMLLSKDPKYSLVFPPDRMKLLIEIERMNSKVRYSENNKKKEKNNPESSAGKFECKARITDSNGNPIEWHQVNHKVVPDTRDLEVNKAMDNNKLDDTLGDLFQRCRKKFTFDPVENTIDFTARKATDYKLNKNVYLPRPMDSNRELQCELRRTNYLKAFDRYQKEIQDMDTKSRRNITNKESEGKKNKHGSNEKKKSGNKNKKQKRDPINLQGAEIDALRSLKDRMKEGELVVTQTDKSSRFAVLTQQQYLESGKVHTKKDKEISWKEVRYIQTQINSHVWWLSHILGYASKTDPARMLRNIQNHHLEVPDMALLIKDHKKWDPSSKTPVPSRPVVSGNSGVNTHLSEMISELLEPLILEMGGGEVASTEEALYAITEVNKLVNNDISEVNVLEKLVKKVSDNLDGGERAHGTDHSPTSHSPVGMDGMNNCGGDISPSTPEDEYNGPVGMDGMNNCGGDSSPTTHFQTEFRWPVGMDGMNNCGGDSSPTTPLDLNNLTDACEIATGDLLNDSDEQTIDILTTLFMEGGDTRGEKIEVEQNKQHVARSLNTGRKLARGDIRQYFQKEQIKDGRLLNIDNKYKKWSTEKIASLRNQAKSASFNDAIRSRCQATSLWRNLNRETRENLKKNTSKLNSQNSQNFMDKEKTSPPLT